ncbi:MAG: hypothetical protein FJ004_09790 [Chloroflexi bacterium]|nr:hypothetical protein [Chloroflexota bacterium]
MAISEAVGKDEEVMCGDEFAIVGKQEFRRYFQPSRILIGVLPAPTRSGFNLITLCYDMYCSKTPILMAVAIQSTNASYELAQCLSEYVLSVPGTRLANETLYCGTKSMRETDKLSDLGLKLSKSKAVSVPGLSAAIGNIELVKEAILCTGDHLILVGQVLCFNINPKNEDLPLLSVGPNTKGYRVLVHSGVHRIAVADG